MECDFDFGGVEKLKGSGLLHCGQPFRTITHCDLTKECIDVTCRLVSCKLTTLNLGYNKITDTNVASLCEALRAAIPKYRLEVCNIKRSNIPKFGMKSVTIVSLNVLILSGLKQTEKVVSQRVM